MSRLPLKKNFDTLTCLRGVLALWVVFYHLEAQYAHLVSSWLSAIAHLGYIAVDFFFVLSGFVLAMTYQDKLSSNFTSNNLVSFYIKRVARIYPLHLGVLVLYLLYLCAFILTERNIPSGGRFDLSGLFMSLTLINNWGSSNILVWNIPSWSISTEFSAYLIFPFIAIILNKVRSYIWLFFVMGICCISISYLYYQKSATSIGEFISLLGIWRCLFEFTLGMLIYSFYRKGVFNHQSTIRLFIAMVLLLFICKGFELPDFVWIPLFMMLFISFFVCLETYSTIKSPRLLLWLGDVSYSVYLIHYLIKDVMKLFLETEQASWQWILIYFVIVLGSSHFIYHFYEIPIKRKVLNKCLPLASGVDRSTNKTKI